MKNQQRDNGYFETNYPNLTPHIKGYLQNGIPVKYWIIHGTTLNKITIKIYIIR